MSWDQLLQPGVIVRASPVETDRFGCSFERVTIGPGPLEAGGLLAVIEDLVADVLVVRYDASRLELAGTLACSRRAVLPAGTLTYWEKPVSAARPPGLSSRKVLSEAGPPEPSDLEVLSAAALDLETVSAVVREIVRASFRDYGNHYLANPLLDRAAALAGYEDWAVRSLGSDPGNVLVLAEGAIPIGMATLEPGSDGDHLEILLAGLIPAAQGRRLYAGLLDGCERAALARGATQIVISTQVHNVRVQRAWARHGLRPFAAIETVHLVNRDLLAPRRRPVRAQRG
ncbi:MAG: GNAT family N-acetyltransferase [Streptosporangiaceae bacterium]